MPASIVARVVRMPVLAAAVVVPMLVTACSNDPLSPVAPRSQISSASAAPVDAGASTTASGGTVPWFRAGSSSATASTSGGTVPWFRDGATQPTSTSSSTASTGGTVPWF